MRKTKTLEDRFLSKVDKSEGCWLWIGAKTRGNYGHMRYKKSHGWVMKRSHIVSYELYKGDTKGLLVCHTCDNPSCVNPDHLWLGTVKDNADDMVSKGRGTKKKTRCKLTEELVASMRELYSKGVKQKDLATMFGVKRNTVSIICSLKRWIP
jgi:hypothetical protein